jgi:hypothetical protein
MAEAAGLAIGIVSLVVTLKSCIELFDTFYSTWTTDDDLKTLVLKLKIEKALLIQWAQQSGLTDEDRQSFDDRFGLALPILEEIRSLLSNGDRLQTKYGA